MLPTEAQRRSVVMSCFQPTFAEYYQVCLDLSCSLVAIRKEHILVHVRGQREAFLRSSFSQQGHYRRRTWVPMESPVPDIWETERGGEWWIFRKNAFTCKEIKVVLSFKKLLFRVSALGRRMFGSQWRSLSHPPRFWIIIQNKATRLWWKKIVNFKINYQIVNHMEWW